jgi:ATP-dependent RNA helicase DeaD
VTAEWGAAPGADDVQAKDDLRILEHPALTAPVGDESGIAGDLLEQFGAEALAAAFVRLWREGRSAPEVLSTDLPVPPQSAPRERGEFGPSVWFRISVGRSGRAEARWLLPKICDAGSIAKDGIGAIRVREDETFVQIAEPLSARFGAQVELDKGLVMERIEGEPDLDAPRGHPRPERPARPEARERSEKPAYTPKPPRVVEDASTDAPAREYAPKPKAKYEDRPRAAPVEARPEWKDKREDRPAPRPADDRPRPAAKPYADRAPRPDADADRKPRWSPDQKTAPRSTGFKSHGGSPDKPARATGYKSHSSEGAGYKGRADGARSEGYKPRTEGYKPREAGDGAARKPYAGKTEGYKPRAEGYKPRDAGEGAARKPYAAKSEGYKPREDGDRAKKTYAPRGDDSRPFVKRDGPAKPGGFKKPFEKKPFDRAAAPARPAKPKADAKDTSKRFVPPKGPKR